MAGKRDRMSGNEAVALAIKQVNPDVMPAFPITPSTEIPQMVSTFIANGEIDTEFIPVVDGKRQDFDYDHCKGCGICAKICSFKAINMKEGL